MPRRPLILNILFLLSLFATALTQSTVNTTDIPPSSYPHDYPGKPKGDYSPEWQNYFEVTDLLPNVTFPLPRSYAGSISVNRPNHPNNTLFFWAFESENGSLTDSDSKDKDCEDDSQEDKKPWGIWLNGGPGSSSLLGTLLENGPLRITPAGGFVPNNYSWDKLIDYFWIDQPVGTGYSTADSNGYIADEDQMAEDFLGFLSNLVKVFPNLSKRPLFLTGESYAGTYIPYIMKAYFNEPSPPVKIAKIAIGNAAIGSLAETQEMPVMQVIETYPQLIGHDVEVFEYFKTQAHLCGYDINLTYPQEGGYFPTLTALDDLDSVLDFDSSTNTDLDLDSNSGLVSVSVSTSEGSSGTNSVNVSGVNISGRDSGSGLKNLKSVSDWESESGEMKSSFENEVDIADTLASESTSTGKSPTSNSNGDRHRPSRRRSTDFRLSRRRRKELVDRIKKRSNVFSRLNGSPYSLVRRLSESQDRGFEDRDKTKSALRRTNLSKSAETLDSQVDGDVVKLAKRTSYSHSHSHGWNVTRPGTLQDRANGTIDPWYGCYLLDELMDYALNYSFPWNITREVENDDVESLAPYNPYDIPDARFPPVILDPRTFLNDNRTRKALHAPTSKDWLFQFDYPFGSTYVQAAGSEPFGDPSPEPMTFLTELATNLTRDGIEVILYSGNDDAVVAHFSTEVVIQNTTFGGIQGFSERPSATFCDVEGSFAGVVHEERGWTYGLFANAGHQVPEYAPSAAYKFFEEYILGRRREKGEEIELKGSENVLLGGDVVSLE